MKKQLSVPVILIMLVWGCLVSGSIAAEENATKQECLTKVGQAAELVEQIGLKPALEKMMDQNGPFKWKDSCVFCMEGGNGKLLAHPILSRFIGFPMKTYKDADEKQPFVKVLEEIETRPNGWVEYYYRPQGAQIPKLKKTYFMKIPGENAILCAGYYE